MTKIEELEQKLIILNKMHAKAKEDFESISNELNECQKALAELKESKKEGKWKPAVGETYWFINDGGETNWGVRQEGDLYAEWRLNNIPLFKTEQECERYWHFMDTVKEKSYEFTELEWKNDEIRKYTIYYNFLNDEFCTTCISDSKFLGEIYFRTKEDAEYIINNFKHELLTYWL